MHNPFVPPQIRVPHLRHGFIVPKVGIGGADLRRMLISSAMLRQTRKHTMTFTKLTAATLSTSLIFLTGCLVGPKYTKPVVPPPPAYKESVPAAYNNAVPGEWQPAKPQDAALKGKWWEIFNEPELNQLEDQVNVNNQNIAQAFQTFMAARATVREARAGLFPTLTTAPSYTRSRSPATLHGAVATGSANNGTTFDEISLPFDVSWEPDLWGKIRNTIRENQYAAQVSAADLENERLTEQASLAEFYFQLRGQDALQDIYDQTVVADQKLLDLTKALYETGIDDEEAVAQADITLKNAQEVASGIATNRALFEHAIAMLIGKPASSFSLPIKNLSTPLPPIPVGLPSELLERRPDIAAAERTLAEANALIGVEKAAYYPSLSLTGSGGLESSMIQSLFSAPAFFWSAAGSATQTIFDAGLRKATVDQFTAQYNADVAAYKQTVLTAFQQVEDFVATLRVNSEQIQRQDDAVQSAQHYLSLATARYETGVDPYLNVLNAQDILLSDQTTQVTLRTSQMTAAVQLIQALGGGWSTAQLPAAATITSKAAAAQVQNAP
jgi:NodT family efflux transporter outer membrane factor (OMF) lipoprotein